MSAKIIVIKNKPINEIAIGKDITTIGRRPDCDIRINDPTVSGNHALLRKVDGNYLIQDMDSTNGIHVHGHPVKEYLLKNEDLVNIGHHQLKFVEILSSIDPGRSAHLDRTLLAEQSPVAGFLQVIAGKNSGSKITLEKGLTTIGIQGRQMAAVSRRPLGHFIVHVGGGSDGDKLPLVNGEPTGFKFRKLEAGDLIEVDGTRMEYRVSATK